MNITKNSSGFSVVELVVVVVVAGLLGTIGSSVYSRQQDKKADVATQSSSSNDDIPSAPTISSIEDLSKADQTIDAASSEETKDSAQLEADLAAF